MLVKWMSGILKAWSSESYFEPQDQAGIAQLVERGLAKIEVTLFPVNQEPRYPLQILKKVRWKLAAWSEDSIVERHDF